MVPLYFGTSSARLFGVYHPAESAQHRSCGVVICPPFGHEYIRAHRLLRQLAVQLSRDGFHVLRFDYLGCGDSSGDPQTARPRSGRADIATAIDELRDTSEVRRVCLVGLRLGATLAARLRPIGGTMSTRWCSGIRFSTAAAISTSCSCCSAAGSATARARECSPSAACPGAHRLSDHRRDAQPGSSTPLSPKRSRPAPRRIVVLDSEDHESQRQWVIADAGEWQDVMRQATGPERVTGIAPTWCTARCSRTRPCCGWPAWWRRTSHERTSRHDRRRPQPHGHCL